MSTEEKVEMEQVPLKSDTDAPAAESENPAATETAPKKPLFSFFKKVRFYFLWSASSKLPLNEA